MTTTFALAGKGGVGKTTLAGLLIRHLAERGDGPVLAVDADPSSNLNMVLGLDLPATVGDIREALLDEVKQSLTASGAAMGTLSRGQTKHDYLAYEVRAAMAEGDRCDLIAMGQPEGPGCYCAVNHNLRAVIDAMGRQYRYVVIDNEAGMEHLSRRTTRDVDFLLIISDATVRGLVAARRIVALQDKLAINVGQAGLIINRVEGPLPAALADVVNDLGAPLWGNIPLDPKLAALDQTGAPIGSLEAAAPSLVSLSAIAARMG